MQSKCSLKLIDPQTEKEYAYIRNKEINYHSAILLIAKVIMLIFSCVSDYIEYKKVINTELTIRISSLIFHAVVIVFSWKVMKNGCFYIY